MKQIFWMVLIIIMGVFSVKAQDTKSLIQRTPIKSWYAMNSGEFIFSAGELKISDKAVYDPFGSINTITDPDNKIRFSAFFTQVRSCIIIFLMPLVFIPVLLCEMLGLSIP